LAFRTLQFFLAELFSNIRRNLLMAIASISTVTILIFFFGFTLLFFINFQKLSSTFAGEMEMHAYLKGYVTHEQGLELARRASAIPHVSSASYVSKEEALIRLRQDLKQDIQLSGIISNPLPAYLLVKVDDPERLPPVADQVAQMTGVDQVNYLQQVVRQFVSLFKAVQRILSLLVLFILICALLIIHNTIRLGVFSRKREIEIMKLVGASHGFIRWPFILEGACYGFSGAVLAVLLLTPSYHALMGRVTEFFPLLPEVSRGEIWSMLLALLGAGALVGGSGSFLSVNRYLHY